MSKTYSAGFAYRIFHILIIGLLLFSSLGTAVESVAAGPANIPQLDPYTCTDPLGCVDIAPTEPIHIAYALVLSGNVSFLGIDERNGAEIAIDDAGGQILGHDILFDGVDSECSDTGGTAAGTALAADPSIVAVVGTSCSSAALTAMPILSAAGYSMVSPSNTLSSLTEPGDPDNSPGYFRTVHNDNYQATSAAQYAREQLGALTAATIDDGSPYTSQLRDIFVAEFTALGGIITDQEAISPGQTDMSVELAAISVDSPRVIFMPSFIPEAGHIINQAKATPGLEGTFLLGTDSLYVEDVTNNLGENAEGFLVTAPDTTKYSSAYYDSFLPDYQAKFGYEPTSMFHVFAYDAFMMIKAAIESVAVVHPDDSIHIGRQALRDALYATTDFPGLTGSLTCSATGDCADPHIGVFEYHTGEYPPELIWPGFVPMSFSAPNCDDGGLIQSVEAIDPLTVTFNLCRPDAAFRERIAVNGFSIYPEKWLEATSGPEFRTPEGLDSPVGTGPYQVSTWNKGSDLTLVSNPDYWGAAPETDTLVFSWQADPADRLLALQSSSIDGFDNVDPADYATVESDSNLQLVSRMGLNTAYIGMTNTFTPFDDVRVRQAIAMGINRQAIIDAFYPPGSEVASHFTPCGIPNGCAGNSWYAFDPTSAQALLADAGYPSGFSTTLYYRDVYRSYLPDVGNLALNIQAQLLANLGIDVTLVVMDDATFISESQAGNLDGLYLLGWVADYSHASNFLDWHFGQQSRQFGNPFAEIYNNLESASQYADPASAEPFYAAANNAIKDLVPMVPVAHAASAVAYRADVTNPQASPAVSDSFAVSDPGGRSTFNWMQTYEPFSLFCADEFDGESLRACNQVMQGLYTYANNSVDAEPALATSCTPNGDLTIWTCDLRPDVVFHDGSLFDANDVVATFLMGLDESSPTHKGRTNNFTFYQYFFGLIPAPEVGSPGHPIKLVFTPTVDQQAILDGGQVMADALNLETGLSFEVVVPNSASDAVNMMCASRNDTIGFLPSIGFVFANDMCGADVAYKAIRFGWGNYWTQVLVPRGSALNSITDLDGLTWGYPDAGSASGYMAPLVLWDDAGITPGGTAETGGHPQAVMAVYNGDVDFSTTYFSPPLKPEGEPAWQPGDDPDIPDGLVDTCGPSLDGTQLLCSDWRVLDARAAVLNDAPDVVQQVRILGISPEIPNDATAFGPDFPPDLRTQVEDALLVFSGTGDWFNSVGSGDFYGWEGLTGAIVNEFDFVRNMITLAGLTLEDWGQPNYSYTLHAVPTYPEVHGHDWVPGSNVTLTIDNDTDPGNGVLYTETKNVDTEPLWCGYPCFDLDGAFVLEVGQYVSMSDGNVTKTVQVAPMVITEVDPDTDTVSGVGDPGERLAVNIWSQGGTARYVTIEPGGTWVADFSVFGDEDFEQNTADIGPGYRSR